MCTQVISDIGFLCTNFHLDITTISLCRCCLHLPCLWKPFQDCSSGRHGLIWGHHSLPGLSTCCCYPVHYYYQIELSSFHSFSQSTLLPSLAICSYFSSLRSQSLGSCAEAYFDIVQAADSLDSAQNYLATPGPGVTTARSILSETYLRRLSKLPLDDAEDKSFD